MSMQPHCIPWAPLQRWETTRKAPAHLSIGPSDKADTEVYLGDPTSLPYPDESFWGVDIVHADLTPEVMAECMRVLRPLGVVAGTLRKPFRLIEWGKP